MSSYNQVEEMKTLADTLSHAITVLRLLEEEMADLCATIAGRFPKKYETIAKYQQAYVALQTLRRANEALAVDAVPPSSRNLPVTLWVGRQTRFNRPTSQRVRLGNAVARLRGVTDELTKWAESGGGGQIFVTDLREIIEALDAVVFPVRHG